MRWILIVLAVFAGMTTQPALAATFQGEIADSSCALNVHSLSRSHSEMLKSRSFGPDAAACSRRCVKEFGASFVLVQDKNVYQLSNQIEAEKWAGQTVVINGKLNSKSNTILVKSIQSAR